jgi:glycosyltransferase involved in cell wall biosynthesis
MRKHFVFVMEQGLGHVVHSMNLEQVLRDEAEFDATILRIRPTDSGLTSHLPVARNWSVQMSVQTRRALYRTMQTRRPDALFIHTQVAALCAAKVMREVPTVVSLDATPLQFDTMAEAYRHPQQAPWLERKKLWANRRALAGAKAVVTWSKWAAESVVHDYGIPADRVHPIYPGVEIGRFRPTSKHDHDGPLRVLFVGGDFARKGGTDLVEALVALDGRVELDVVSSAVDIHVPPALPIRLHRGVSPNSDQLLELMASADAFALPTRGDTLALAVTEAMASGLPVVATTVGAIPNMIVDGVNGILVPPGDVQAIVRALQTLASDRSLCLRMGAAGRALAESQHNTATNWRKIFALMTTAANGYSQSAMVDAMVTPEAQGVWPA